MRADIGKLRRGLGSPEPPKDITQEPYMGNTAHLRRLARGDWRARLPKPADLFAYVEDINYVEVIQADLFRYMLPVLLEMWRQDLTRENRDNGGTVEWLYMALARRRPVKRLLGDRADEAAGAFMRDAILDRIDLEEKLSFSGEAVSPHKWMGALGGFAILFPDLESLWRQWWGLDTRGQAAGLLQYVSALMYDEGDNPIFSPWTETGGGGTPCIWDTDGHIYDQCWRPENVDFIREFMTLDRIERGVRQAADRLKGEIESDVPDRMVRDFRFRNDLIERRLQVLPEILGAPQHQYLDWSDLGV